MRTKKQVERLSKSLGVTITDDQDLGRLWADTPSGKRFESDLHCIVADYGDNGTWDHGPKAEAWDDLGERLTYYAKAGLESCPGSCGR